MDQKARFRIYSGGLRRMCAGKFSRVEVAVPGETQMGTDGKEKKMIGEGQNLLDLDFIWIQDSYCIWHNPHKDP